MTTPTRLYERSNNVSISPVDERTRENTIDRLERALELARSLPHQQTDTPILRDALALGEMSTLLDSFQSKLPLITCWCVVKHYDAPGWSPAVWTAHLLYERAEEFAVAVRKQYGDSRFEVELRPASITSVINPELTADEYRKSR